MSSWMVDVQTGISQQCHFSVWDCDRTSQEKGFVGTYLEYEGNLTESGKELKFQGHI